MIEIHGLRVTRGAPINEDLGTQALVMDDPPYVRLSQPGGSPALLTPDEAVWLARQLMRAAARVRLAQERSE